MPAPGNPVPLIVPLVRPVVVIAGAPSTRRGSATAGAAPSVIDSVWLPSARVRSHDHSSGSGSVLAHAVPSMLMVAAASLVPVTVTVPGNSVPTAVVTVNVAALAAWGTATSAST